MLEEAIDLIRELWKGEQIGHDGEHSWWSTPRSTTPRPSRCPLSMYASGPKAAEAAGRIGDAMVVTSGDKELVKAFGGPAVAASRSTGRRPSARGRDEASAKKTLREIWPTGAIEGMASQELPLPLHFEQLTKSVTEDQLAEHTPCGPDIDRHVASLQEYVDAGVDHVDVHQVGPRSGSLHRGLREGRPAAAPRPAHEGGVGGLSPQQASRRRLRRGRMSRGDQLSVGAWRAPSPSASAISAS